VLTDYDFFFDRTGPNPAPEIELSSALIEVASQFANAGEGNVYFKEHVAFLKRLLGIVEQIKASRDGQVPSGNCRVMDASSGKS
jgi:hypothetical protein